MALALKRSLLVGFAVAMAVLIVACGGSSSGTGGSSSASAGKEKVVGFPETQENSAIVSFGDEASTAEREAANTVLQKNLTARAAADFTAQCATLNATMIAKLVGKNQKDPTKACPDALRKVAEPLASTKSERKNTLEGPIAELRVVGSKGYALYHGNDGNDYAMPMKKENGGWKVTSLVTNEI